MLAHDIVYILHMYRKKFEYSSLLALGCILELLLQHSTPLRAEALVEIITNIICV